MHKTPFQQVLPARLFNALRRIKDTIWEVESHRLPVSALPPTRDHIRFDEIRGEFNPLDQYPDTWGMLYDQRWFRIDIQNANEGDYLFWKDQGEATLYVDGVPAGGFDPGHAFVRLPKKFKTLHIEGTCCRTGIWVTGGEEVWATGVQQGISDEGSICQGAYLARRNDAAWEACHDIEVLLDVASQQFKRDGGDANDFKATGKLRTPLDRVDPIIRRILTGIDLAVDAYDLDGPVAAIPVLKAIYDDLQQGSTYAKAMLTGHAHIDLVWLWPERQGDAKAIHTFSSMLNLLDDYPEFIFGYSQPASYRAVEKRAPKLFEKVKERIKEGRWEAVGAMEVESDTNLSCGEGLVRSMLVGQEWFKEHTGNPSPVVWLPDVFGYVACLPQIIKECGSDYFFTTKIAWSNYTVFPFSSFHWEGADGTRVIAHLKSGKNDNGYNGEATVHHIVEPCRCNKQSGIFPEAIVPTGYGDGGGGTSAMMCERVRRLDGLLNLPSVHWGRIDAFFDRLAEKADDLPVWHGEMFLEFHRGVHTTHANLKQAFRSCERALQTWEAVRAATNTGCIPQEIWQRLVFAQFHDYIPGSSIAEVYDEGIPELDGIADNALKQAENELTSAGKASCLFNPLPLPIVANHADKHIRIPALSAVDVSLVDATQNATPGESPTANNSRLSNGRVQVEFNNDGTIESLSFDGKRIATEGPLGQLTLYPDHPAVYDAWDIDRNTLANPVLPLKAATLIDSSANDETASFIFSQQLSEQSSASITYSLDRAQAVLRIRYDIDWQDRSWLLQTMFPTAYRGKYARYGAPFGSVLRPQMESTPAADAQYEVPASRWAIVANDAERQGLALITKDRYGFGCVRGTLHSSLVRSARITQSHVTQWNNTPKLRRWKDAEPFSDIGQHTFEIALAWGGIDVPRAEQPAALADTLFTEPVAFFGATFDAAPFTIEGADTLIPSWVKPAEDGRGIILRLHETRGQSGTALLKLAEGWNANECKMDETTTNTIPENGQLSFRPNQVVSVRLEANKANKGDAAH